MKVYSVFVCNKSIYEPLNLEIRLFISRPHSPISCLLRWPNYLLVIGVEALSNREEDFREIDSVIIRALHNTAWDAYCVHSFSTDFNATQYLWLAKVIRFGVIGVHCCSFLYHFRLYYSPSHLEVVGIYFPSVIDLHPYAALLHVWTT